MAKVRVQKAFRPPAIEFTETERGFTQGMRFRCVKFRRPRAGDFYYYPASRRLFRDEGKGIAIEANFNGYSSPFVILERVK
jgi:hypothetical protein